jgi:hypothetical protein
MLCSNETFWGLPCLLTPALLSFCSPHHLLTFSLT